MDTECVDATQAFCKKILFPFVGLWAVDLCEIAFFKIFAD